MLTHGPQQHAGELSVPRLPSTSICAPRDADTSTGAGWPSSTLTVMSTAG